MVRRSVLFSPADRPELLRKAPGSGADTLVFDLEDAVAPGQKDAARAAVSEVLADRDFDPDAEVAVRLNAEPAFEEDIDALSDTSPDAVMVPKVTDTSDVVRVEDTLSDQGLNCPVFSLVESATGILNAPDIARLDATKALVLGAEDLAVDLGADRTADGTEILYARQRVVTAAAAAGIDAIDTPFTNFEDRAGLRDDAQFSRQLGFDGKLAIHPKQVSVINEAFTPDEDRVDWARHVLEAREAADGSDRGVFEVDGEMIDAPLLARAERILEHADDSM